MKHISHFSRHTLEKEVAKQVKILYKGRKKEKNAYTLFFFFFASSFQKITVIMHNASLGQISLMTCTRLKAPKLPKK